jgi:hypothetical protein
MERSYILEKTEKIYEDSNIPGTETPIKIPTKEVPQESIKLADSYLAPDRSYAINNPPSYWEVPRELTQADWVNEGLSVTDPKLREAVIRNFLKNAPDLEDLDKAQTAKEIVVFESKKSYLSLLFLLRQ